MGLVRVVFVASGWNMKARGIGFGLRNLGGFPKSVVCFRAPFHKDFSVLGSRLGSPILGNYNLLLRLRAWQPEP